MKKYLSIVILMFIFLKIANHVYAQQLEKKTLLMLDQKEFLWHTVKERIAIDQTRAIKTTDSLNVRLISHLGEKFALSIFVKGDTAFLGAVNFEILDCSDPRNPIEVGNAPVPDGAFFGLEVIGNYAYLADESAGLRVFDISSLSNPKEIGYFDTGHRAIDVSVVDNFAYIADYYDGLRVIDISNPFSPHEVGYYDTECAAFSVYVRDDYAYVADNWCGLRIIDVSNPTSPDQIGHYDTENAWEVYINGIYAYVADGQGGLRIVDISNPTNPWELGYFDTGPYTIGVHVRDNFVYVVDDRNGLRIIDVSNPTNPQEVGYYFLYGQEVFVSDNYIYVVGIGGFYILEFLGQLPESPKLLQPLNNFLINNNQPSFSWNSPLDTDGDLLHFKVEISNDGSFTNQIPGSPFESLQNIDGFNPVPPLAEGTGSCSFRPVNGLADGEYWWRVTAWDGRRYGDVSDARKFIIDTTPPFTENLYPLNGSTDISRNTNITFNILDATAGVDSNSINFKINGEAVDKTIAGNSTDYFVNYSPKNMFEYDETIYVEIKAHDLAGNIMDNVIYSFTVEQNPNSPPQAPICLTPLDNHFTNDLKPILTWRVPKDFNNDHLHFKIEIDTLQIFTNPKIVVESNINSHGFEPLPPIRPDSGVVSYAFSDPLEYNKYYWRVLAYDGIEYSEPSEIWKFTITPDTTEIKIPHNLTASIGDTANIPIYVSTKDTVSIAQFVVEYNSSILNYLSCEDGKDANNFSIMNENVDLPFQPVSNETDKNVLIQLSGGTRNSFYGKENEVLIVHFQVLGAVGDSSILVIDGNPLHTNLTSYTSNSIPITQFENGSVKVTYPTAINSSVIDNVSEFLLLPNYPNPFNQKTKITFQLPESDFVKLEIFNLQGQKIKTLVNEKKSSGSHNALWDSKNDNGKLMVSGTYVYRIKTSVFQQCKKMILLK
jgi:hypothetical protein